ncbi:assimilatory sulfite reductase (NADPH) flavoprotein subunit [Bacillus changyiensis]|uniref:assimilatory sulfite reductase (NADPH) flavoprotein subunit n=1 Tax=Bacillus changyiensis TaxID=3004103 RepID=UPI0022E617F4|nr:assimilatory sulfite reductase (NADPH) flavoprotein subunit [Bacillus changyiensis]MDA1475858.1 assimilatory sulfite reductase (NADPH) flavoprotein subunit [Bacillus changyiensis]
MQFQVMNSPFNQEQTELLNRLLPTLTPSQKIWLSGYLAAPLETLSNETGQHVSKDVTILYGSQTGNAESLANHVGIRLKEGGFQVTVSAMNDFKPKQLKQLKHLLIVVSTHGEGEPPDNALSFYDYLHSKRAPKLDGLYFSVLALGDRSYQFFCQTGKDFDQRLKELGGARLYPRVDCDLDYDEPAGKWLEGVLDALNQGERNNSTLSTVKAPQAGEMIYSRKNPFQAEVLENLNLNGRGSNKETRHLELSLEGSGLTYKPGDVLGIYPENDPELVEMLLKELKWDAKEVVTVNKQGESMSLKEALTSYFEITVLTKNLIQKAAEWSNQSSLTGNETKIKAYLEGRDLLDFVRDFGPFNTSAQQFVSMLRKMPARLYSIASSFMAYPDEVHITIGTVRYEAHGRNRKGVCSTLCSERIQPGDTLPVYIQANQNFKLPENSDTPIVMVGPGTGVAPFRSFMQEREETGATGKSWMFFGDQHFVTDFLYQTEWQNWLKTGVLTKMDVAFSRDSAEKIYVQHRMLEHSKELFEWLEEGAVFYVCGDKKKMAKDVHHTLLEILQKEGNMSFEKAEAYLTELKQQKRYQRDVY